MRCWLTVGMAFLATSLFSQEPEKPLPADQVAFFEAKIRPVLIKECYSCHSSETGSAKGGLRLDTERVTLLGGESGPAVVPGEPDASLLLAAIRYDGLAMPPNHQLSEEVIKDFENWIAMGAPDPRKTASANLRSAITDEDVDAARRNFWAFQPIRATTAPAVTNQDWIDTEIDRFVLAKLESEGLPAPTDASPAQLVRRLYFDLIGLPPSYEQIETFTANYRQDADLAIRTKVDELLADKRFGERWARHWLDLVRYAESSGREVNMTQPYAWRYRDYVIKAFNEDKPYDRFVQEQIAGDLLPVKTDEQWAENLIATTFLAMGSKSLNEQNGAQFRMDLADEQLDVTTRAFMGLSVACARCHDHKFDPIRQSDYYALAGIFLNTETFFGPPASEFGALSSLANRNRSTAIVLPVDAPSPYDKPLSAAELNALTEQLRDLRRQMVEIRREMNQSNQNSIAQIIRIQTQAEALSSRLGSFDKDGKPLSFTMGVQDRSRCQDTAMLVRGELDQPAQIVPRGMPTVLADQPIKIPSDHSGRLELAKWLTAPSHPLTARVAVNRIWKQLLGQGLVRTTEDFGASGTAPTHPELLDHLATRFIEQNWSTKDLIRQITSSHVYRISSAVTDQAFNRDPDNELLWRYQPKRLEAEQLRDAMLLVSGRLDLNPPQASEVAKLGYTQVRDGNLIGPAQVMAMSGMQMDDMEMARGNMGGMMGRQDFARELNRRDPERFRQLVQDRRRGNDQVDMVQSTYRSIYLPIIRDQLPRSLEVFDYPDSSIISGQRESSSTANQALFLLNNDFVINQSDAFAKRLEAFTANRAQQIDLAYQSAYGRQAQRNERSRAMKFLQQYEASTNYSGKSSLALSAFCQALFASAEFRLIE